MVKVVYDCDDVLLGLNDAAHKIVGIDPDSIIDYNIYNNVGRITMEQADNIMRAYKDVNTFREAKFYKGHDDIFKVENMGLANVYIHSLSLTEDIVNYKLEALTKIYGLNTPDRLILDCGERKTVLEKLDILVEDSIGNVKKSKAKIGNILIKKTYNRPHNYGVELKSLRAIEADDLEHANRLVIDLITGKITV